MRLEIFFVLEMGVDMCESISSIKGLSMLHIHKKQTSQLRWSPPI